MLLKKIPYTFSLILSILLLFNTIAQACWAYLSPKDLFAQSDLILAGKILGPESVFKDHEVWMTNWKVQVDYVFSGTIHSAELLVATPGAKGKGIMTSIDYALDAWGDDVLLFMREQDGRLEPLSPQGIIAIKRTGKTTAAMDTGEDFLEVYQFTDDSVSEYITDIAELLRSKKLTVPSNNKSLTNVQPTSFFKRLTDFLRTLFADNLVPFPIVKNYLS